MPRTAITLFLAASWLSFAPAAPAQDIPDSLRQGLAMQIALERAGFSAGVIDGKCGWKATFAIHEFQLSRNIPATGQPDDATRAALNLDPAGVLAMYRVQQSDYDQLGPVPRKWADKAELDHLGYPSLDEELAEQFHCTRGLLATLNPGKNVAHLKVGESLVIPNLGSLTISRGARVEISLSKKCVRVLAADGRPVGLFFCSVAKHKEKLPSGSARVVTIVNNPTYRFDPRMYPEVKSVHEALLIPPGPRNPVGLCWIGLNKPGYGMHGTPNAELIGKTGSHGCFRLANWDAVRLGKMIRVGTTVTFLK
jgi:lipoprotein-anchoring transpeptidase ErfK/SrfK